MASCPQQVESVVRLLRQIDPGVGVWLFGSWARGTAGAHSDVDVLVVPSTPERVDDARDTASAAGISALVTSHGQLERLPATSPLFGLHLSKESVRLTGSCRLPSISWTSRQDQQAVRTARARLKAAARDLRVWGVTDDAAQAVLFAAVKEWAMVRTASEGRPLFDRWLALRHVISPDAETEEALELLEDVWLCKRNRRPAPALEDPERAVSVVLRSVPVDARA